MIKIFFTQFLFLLSAQFLFGQNAFHTDTLFVTGKVKSEWSFPISAIKEYKSDLLGDVNTSCSAKQREDSKGVKGVLVKTLLDTVEFDYENRKMLNEFYFKFEAVDGYTVVYSFNEIYNTETGNHLYIVTEMNGKEMGEIENRILLLTMNDIKTGNRNIKGLKRIVVCRAE